MHQTLAQRLDHLFDAVRRPDGQEYTNEQVANAVTAKGVAISQSYIWQLRKQKKDNPTLKHLQALADFFGVPPAYFFDDAVAGQINEQIEALRAEQARLSEAAGGNDARLMAMRAGELSADRRRQVMELLDVVYRLEKAERGDTQEPGS